MALSLTAGVLESSFGAEESNMRQSQWKGARMNPAGCFVR